MTFFTDDKRYAYHCTNVNPDIIKGGFEVGNGFTEDNQLEDIYKKYLPEKPCFISQRGEDVWDSDSKYVLKIDISGLDLYPDFGHLLDFDAYIDEDGDETIFYWEDKVVKHGIPENSELSEYIKENDGYLYPSEFSGQESIDILGTACIDGEKLTPDRIVDVKTKG